MAHKKRKIYGWEHIGGGTLMVAGEEFPSDDSYRHKKTGEVVTVRCTTERHFKMPLEVRYLSDLYRLSGVKRP